jgi:hypothetical protein
MDNNSVGKFVGASGLRQASGQGLASGPGSPELGLGVALGQELASAKEQGQGLASGVLPTGLYSDEMERLRTMEKLLALIGDPLGGQGLGTATATGPGLGTELVQEGDVLVTTDDDDYDDVHATTPTTPTTTTTTTTTATSPDTTPPPSTPTSSWLPKVPGF